MFRETPDYKYSQVRFKEIDHTRIFGEVERKRDGKSLKFINVYDKNDKLISTTLKDSKSGDKFYINVLAWEGALDGWYKIIRKISTRSGDFYASSRQFL